MISIVGGTRAVVGCRRTLRMNEAMIFSERSFDVGLLSGVRSYRQGIPPVLGESTTGIIDRRVRDAISTVGVAVLQAYAVGLLITPE